MISFQRFSLVRRVEAAFRPNARRQRSLLSCRRGVAAVEFALAATPLMLLVFGFIATSAVFNTLSSMQSNAQYAARMMSTGQVSQNANGAISSTNLTATSSCGTSFTTSKVEYYACTGLPSWATFTVTTTENCTVPSVTVTLSANAGTAAIAEVAAIFSGTTITGQAVYMKEGSCP